MMIVLNRALKRIRHDERGITAVEYAILAAMVGAAIMALSDDFKNGLGNAFDRVFALATPSA